jgi:hypothetical protein
MFYTFLPFRATLDRGRSAVFNTAQRKGGTMAARVGEKAPEFKLDGVLQGQFKSVSLSDYKGKWLVAFFYPLDFTFV